MVALGGTPRRVMLAARPGDQRRNLFHESGGTSSTPGSFRTRRALQVSTKRARLRSPLGGHAACGCTRPLKRGAAMRDRNERLTVEVRLLPDPCLWCWEIRDAQRDEVLESSWAGEWTAYSSPEEALRAGRRRLTARPAA